LHATRDELLAAGFDCLALGGDVGTAEAARAMIDAVLKRWGRLDIVVNNAGISWGAPAESMPLDRWEAVLTTNVTGTFLVSQAAFEPLRRRGGCILNVASVTGLVGTRPEHLRAAGYTASKGAIVALTRQLAVEWAPHGIRVNAIAPGFFPTRMAQPIIDRHGSELVRDVPQGRHGRPGELKGVVVFLCSDAASYITGATLPVDGGAVAW
jgi:gluconate 5-dehydrogenase